MSISVPLIVIPSGAILMLFSPTLSRIDFMASSELAHALSAGFGQEPAPVGYLDDLRSVTLA